MCHPRMTAHSRESYARAGPQTQLILRTAPEIRSASGPQERGLTLPGIGPGVGKADVRLSALLSTSKVKRRPPGGYGTRCAPRSQTMIQTTSFDSIVGRLDRLPGSLTPSILGLTPETAEQTIAAILEPDRRGPGSRRNSSRELRGECHGIRAEVQTWRRSGAELVRQGSLVLPVTVAGRRLCAF